MKALTLIAALLLAGCASTVDPLTGGYATCSLPVTRDAGLGVIVPGCAAWSFGPTKTQTARFNRQPVQP